MKVMQAQSIANGMSLKVAVFALVFSLFYFLSVLPAYASITIAPNPASACSDTITTFTAGGGGSGFVFWVDPANVAGDGENFIAMDDFATVYGNGSYTFNSMAADRGKTCFVNQNYHIVGVSSRAGGTDCDPATHSYSQCLAGATITSGPVDICIGTCSGGGGGGSSTATSSVKILGKIADNGFVNFDVASTTVSPPNTIGMVLYQGDINSLGTVLANSPRGTGTGLFRYSDMIGGMGTGCPATNANSPATCVDTEQVVKQSLTLSSAPDGFYTFVWYYAGEPSQYMTFQRLNGHWLSNNFGAIAGFFNGTRIDSVVPYDTQIVSTSTNLVIGATGYVTNTDFVTGNTKIRICILRASPRVGSDIFSPVALLNGCNAGTEIFIPAYGAFSVSATTTLATSTIGAYVMDTLLIRPLFSLFSIPIGSETIVATTTTFVLGTTTVADRIALGRLQLLEALNQGTSTQQADNCFPTAGNFNPVSCAFGLFVPDNVQLSVLSSDFNAIIATGPWGFVGTTFLIINGHYFTPDTTILPSMNFDFSKYPNSPVAISADVNLNPFSALGSSTSLLNTATSTGSGKTIRQITEAGWTGFVLLLFILAIFNELVGVGGKAVSGD